MKDPEFVLLRNRFLFGLLFIIVFFVPLVLFLKNKLIINESIIIDKINNEENIVILVTKEECDNCKTTEKILKEQNVTYQKLNRDKDKNYDRILNKINIGSGDILPPTIIYMENGKLVATTIETEENDLKTFIENYNLRSNEG